MSTETTDEALAERALKLHQSLRGKWEIRSKVPVNDMEHLSLAYTPGVAEPCRVIARNPERIYDYTAKGNTVAVATDGSAVLGLGNIGVSASLPVMEGKAILFKEFAGIDAVPVCLNTSVPDEFVDIISRLAAPFGGINLEDISAPRCFEIERKLQERLDIPVFHDDQHGTAVIVMAGLLNALQLTGRRLEDTRIAINGAGAAGIAITRFLLQAGATDITLCDTRGIIYQGRSEGMNPVKVEIAASTNPQGRQGTLARALEDADVFIGVSVGKLVDASMVEAMRPDPIIFALANPTPEITPDAAYGAGAAIVGTGRSDYPNQVNNVLGFPGIFRGALDARAPRITEPMKLAASRALASLVQDELRPDYIIPAPFDRRVVPAVARAVAAAAQNPQGHVK